MKNLNHTAPHKVIGPSAQSGIALVISLIFLLVSTLLALSTLTGNVSEEKMARNNLQRQVAFEAAEIALLEAEAFVEEDSNAVHEWVFYSASGSPDNDVASANIGDTCDDGYCTPVRKSLNFNVDAPAKDRWEDASLAVWTTNNKHKRLSQSVTDTLKLAQQPKYIIEFMRYVPPYLSDGSLDFSNCDSDLNNVASSADTYVLNGVTYSGTGWGTWPFCKLDNKEYRITALGFAGNNNESRVMLQSVYVAD